MDLPTSSFFFSLGAAALLVAAAVSDLRRFIIPNWINLALVVLFVIRFGTEAVAGSAMLPLAAPLAPALAVLIAGAFAFHRGWLGGGDVKLLAATVLWLPATRFVDFLTLVAVLGGALAVAVLVLVRFSEPVVAAGRSGSSVPAIRLPYGVAIAGAGLLMLAGVAEF